VYRVVKGGKGVTTARLENVMRSPGWTPNMACYSCHNMVGYQDPNYWAEADRRAYFATLV
jgi:hypothetical protein